MTTTHKKTLLVTVGIAVCLLIAGVLTAVAAPTAQDSPPEGEGGPPNLGADYMGAQVCMACHRDQTSAWEITAHAHFIQEASAETVVGDLTDGVAPTITWPDGAERPLTLDDITYVIGGRYVQQYISVQQREDGARAFYVLPFQWNIPQAEDQIGVWTPYHPDDWTAPERDWQTACAGCHTTALTAEMVTEGWEIDDVELGITCEACHGPGGEHIRKPSENRMVSTLDAQVCGQCHVQGSDPSGVYGYPVGYQPGMPLDESVFIPAGPGDETVWWPSEHAKTYNTYSEWRGSGHATSLETMQSSEYAEDSCLQCHATMPASFAATEAGEEMAWGLEQAEYGVTCVACHNVHPAEGEEGEEIDQPPAMLKDDPYTLCTSCHACCQEEGVPLLVGGELHHPVQGLFEGGSLIEGVEGIPSAHFSVMGEEACTHCHMTQTGYIGEYGRFGTHAMSVPHLSEVSIEQPDACSGCHANISRESLQQFIDSTQADVLRRLRAANDALQAQPDAPEWAERALEFVETDGSLGIHNYAYTDKLLYTAEVELGLAPPTAFLNGVEAAAVEEPTQCAQCHQEAHDLWQTSPHANAALNENFQVEFASRGNPVFCMQCHASGYDPATDQTVHDGVVCSSCHAPVAGATHPPASMQASNASALCGQCHSGAHAPTYNEWLASPHSAAGVDCADCHTPHNNGLILGAASEGTLIQGDVNETCGSCHPEALVDEVHMGDDMNCVDCHMVRRLADDGIHVVATGHTMSIAPETCAGCHGKAHVVSAEEKEPEVTLSPQEESRVEELEGEITRLEDDAKRKWNSGVVGGAIGMLIVIFIGYIVLRRGRAI